MKGGFSFGITAVLVTCPVGSVLELVESAARISAQKQMTVTARTLKNAKNRKFEDDLIQIF
jgi:hypothetical protein